MKISETTQKIGGGVLKGASRGGAIGAVGALATGAAVIATAPAWLPVVGGAMAVSGATVALWTAGGAAIGAVSGGAAEYFKIRKRDKHFQALLESAESPAAGKSKKGAGRKRPGGKKK